MITLIDWNQNTHASKYTAAFPQGMLPWLIDWFNDPKKANLV